MAERSGPSRILACILVGLGAFLLAVAILIPTYTVGKLEKTPLDLEVTTIAEGSGSVLTRRLFSEARPKSTRTFHWCHSATSPPKSPADADVVTLQAGQTLRRTDKQGDTGLLSAIVDRVTVDRQDVDADQRPGGHRPDAAQPACRGSSARRTAVQVPVQLGEAELPLLRPERARHPGHQLRRGDGDQRPEGVPLPQTIDPVDLSKVVSSPTNKLTLPAEAWGVPGGDPPRHDDPLVHQRARPVGRARDRCRRQGPGAAAPVLRPQQDKPEIDVLKVELPFNEADHRIPGPAGQGRHGQDRRVRSHRADRRRRPRCHRADRGTRSWDCAARHGLGSPRTPPATTTRRATVAARSTLDKSEAPTEQHDWTTDKTEEIPVQDRSVRRALPLEPDAT